MVNSFCTTEAKIADLDLPAFSTENRDMVTVAMTSLKNTREEALARAAKPSKKLSMKMIGIADILLIISYE